MSTTTVNPPNKPRNATSSKGKSTSDKDKPKLALVPYSKSTNAFKRVGGDLPETLEKKGFTMNLRQLTEFPSDCPAKAHLKVVPLQLPSGASPLTIAELEAELEKRHLTYSSGCEFLDWVNAQPKKLPESVTFMTKPRRNGRNGQPAWLLASEQDVYAVTAGKDFHPQMVVLCVSNAHAANRK